MEQLTREVGIDIRSTYHLVREKNSSTTTRQTITALILSQAASLYTLIMFLLVGTGSFLVAAPSTLTSEPETQLCTPSSKVILFRAFLHPVIEYWCTTS